MSSLGTATLPRARIDLSKDEAQVTRYLLVVQREHEDIYRAILARDPEAARTMMRMHLTRSRERLRRLHEDAQVNATR